ncbi:hypothetical protein ACHWQZ_G016833 [Mnemiopsis leidyi]
MEVGPPTREISDCCDKQIRRKKIAYLKERLQSCEDVIMYYKDRIQSRRAFLKILDHDAKKPDFIGNNNPVNEINPATTSPEPATEPETETESENNNGKPLTILHQPPLFSTR